MDLKLEVFKVFRTCIVLITGTLSCFAKKLSFEGVRFLKNCTISHLLGTACPSGEGCSSYRVMTIHNLTFFPFLCDDSYISLSLMNSSYQDNSLQIPPSENFGHFQGGDLHKIQIRAAPAAGFLRGHFFLPYYREVYRFYSKLRVIVEKL